MSLKNKYGGPNLLVAQYRCFCLPEQSLDAHWGSAKWGTVARWVGLSKNGQSVRPDGMALRKFRYSALWALPILGVITSVIMLSIPSGRDIILELRPGGLFGILVALIAALVSLIAIPASFSVGGLNDLMDRKVASNPESPNGMAGFDTSWYQYSALGLYGSIVNLGVSLAALCVSIIFSLLTYSLTLGIILSVRLFGHGEWGDVEYGFALSLFVFFVGYAYALSSAFSGTMGILINRMRFPADAI